MTTKTFWLSFCDGERPKGQQFLGVSVVDVDDEDVEDARAVLPRSGDHWVGAAMLKAWRDGCNPGGQMASIEITDQVPPSIPKSRLMQAEELKALGLI